MPEEAMNPQDNASVTHVLEATSKQGRLGNVFEEIQKELANNPKTNRDNLMKGLSENLLKKFPLNPLESKIDELKHDKDLLEDAFNEIDATGNEDGVLEASELTSFKLTGLNSQGKESAAYSPEQLDSIARLAFNPDVVGLDGKPGLTLKDVDLAIEKEKARTSAVPATTETPATSAPPAPVVETPKPAPVPPPAGEVAPLIPPPAPVVETPKPTPAPPPAGEVAPLVPPPAPVVETPKPAPVPPPAPVVETPKPAPVPPPAGDTPTLATDAAIAKGPAPTPPAASEYNYGYTSLRFLKDAVTNELSDISEGSNSWHKNAEGKWIDKNTNLEVPGKFSLSADGTLRHELRKDVYRTVSPVNAEGIATHTIHRSNGSEASALYKNDSKEPYAIVESMAGQNTIWQRDTTDARVWRNGDQIRYHMNLEANGNLNYTKATAQADQFERKIVTNQGVELFQGQDELGKDGLPRYTFDALGRITLKEYAGGNRQNAFSFAYNSDGSDEPINVTYLERTWNAESNKHEAYKTLSYDQVQDNVWKLTTNNVVSGTLNFKPLLSSDGRFSTQHVENGVWVHTDHDQMTRAYLVANNAQQYQAAYSRIAQQGSRACGRTVQPSNSPSACNSFSCRRQRRNR